MGVRGCVPRSMGHSLVILFSLSMSVKDRPLHWILVRSRTYYPEHILAYGGGKDRWSLVMGSDSFLDRLIGGGDGGGLSTTLSPGLRCGGLEFKFGWGPRPLDKRVTGWSCLCLGYKRGVFFGYPAGHIDSRITG